MITENSIRVFEAIPADVNALAKSIVDSAFQVHKALGPGLLETVYETCLCHELNQRNISFKSQVALPIRYNGLTLENGLRLDLLVAEKVVVELKAVEKMQSLYDAQLLTYLKLSGLRLGLLINFNTVLIKDGIKRIVR
jgi:GxxExxY protein